MTISRPHRPAAGLSLAVGLAVVAVVALLGAGAAAPASSAPLMRAAALLGGPDLDGLLRTTLSAAAVRTTSGTYVALGGRDDSGHLAVRVVRVGAEGVSEQLSPPAQPPDGQVGITRLGNLPCLTYAVRDSPYVTCLDGSRWTELRFTGAQRLSPVPAARRCWDTLCVLQATPQPGGRLARTVLRWDGGRWTPAAAPLPAWKGAIAMLGERQPAAERAAGPPLVGVVQGPKNARRRVLAVVGGRWRDVVRVHRGTYGPLVEGPISAGGRTFMAATDTRRHPWSFGVLAWHGMTMRRIALSRGYGNAQGEAALVAGRLWVTWQEQREHRRGTFLNDTQYWLARVNPRDGRVEERRRLWSGLTGFPLRLSVVDVEGKPYILWLEHLRRGGAPVTRPRLEPLDGR